MNRICILIPALNEAETISQVVSGFPKELFSHEVSVLVVDGNSKDQTVELARRAGANVMVQRTKGKGAALKEGIRQARGDIFVIIDGDGTYSPRELDKLVAPIIEDRADVVIGSRFRGEIETGAMTWMNRIGNRIFNWMARTGIGISITDMLSGYRVMRASVFRKLVLLSSHFEIETEMTIESFTRGHRILEVPISYLKRRGSPAKLKSFQDGMKIFRSIVFFIMNTRPLFFFSIVSAVFFVVGTFPASYVLYEKIALGEILHLPSVMLSSLLYVSGALILVFGLLAELVVTARRRIEYSLEMQQSEHETS